MEPGGGLNSRAITGCSKFCDMHILTRESQEVMLGTGNVLTISFLFDIDWAESNIIVCTAIPHSGQLNITNSTISTPGMTAKSIILASAFVVCSVSS